VLKFLHEQKEFGDSHKQKQNGNSNPRPTMVGSTNDKQQKPINNENQI
jgi:hypothetical protein